MEGLGLLWQHRQPNGAQIKVGAIAEDGTRFTHMTGRITYHYTTRTFSYRDFQVFLSFGRRAANIENVARGRSRSKPCNPIRPCITHVSDDPGHDAREQETHQDGDAQCGSQRRTSNVALGDPRWQPPRVSTAKQSPNKSRLHCRGSNPCHLRGRGMPNVGANNKQ